VPAIIADIRFKWLTQAAFYSLILLTYLVDPRLTLLPIALGLGYAFMGYNWLRVIEAVHSDV